MDINIKVCFSDSCIFDIICNTDMQIIYLVLKAILLKNNICDINDEDIPQYLIEKFKLVHNGKLYKKYDDKISTITDIQNNTILNCIFPILSKDEISVLYKSSEVSIQDIENLLNRKDFKEQLKNHMFYNKILELIINNTNILVIDEDKNFKNEIIELHKIGFTNDDKSIYLLKKHNKNMQDVINELLE